LEDVFLRGVFVVEDIKIISTEELKKKLEAGEKLELVDVREDFEVAQGMIPGAKHIPMNEIPANLEYFDKNKEYIFICRSSHRSGNVCLYLHDQGYKVCNMIGGMMEWTGEVKNS
jgi:rhodanese-related sulfurtransferase